MRTDSGQAMLEFIVGLFAFVLIISAMLAFGRVIPEATHNLSLVRTKAGRDAQSASGGDSAGSAPPAVVAAMSGSGAPSEPALLAEETLNFEVDVSDTGFKRFFNVSKFHLCETAVMPLMTIPRIARYEEEEP
jgi:hypothetical protein